MSERRIPKIMGKTGSSNNLSDLLKKRVVQFGMSCCQSLGHIITQRHTDT